MADAIQTKQIKQKSITKQKLHRTKQQQILEQQQQQIVKESVTATQTSTSHLKQEEIMSDERLEEFKVVTPTAIKQLPTISTIQSLGASSDQTAVHISPDEQDRAVCFVLLPESKSIVTQETHVTEHAESSELSVKRQEQHVSIRSTSRINQSVTVTEVDVGEESAEITTTETDLQKPKTSSGVHENLPITVNQPEMSDNVESLRHTKTTESQAEIVYNLHQSKIMSETIVSQSERSLNHLLQIDSQTATESTSNVEAIQMTEVQTQELGSTFEKPHEIISEQAKINIRESQPLQITEVITENTSEKYYPELVVATEVATKTFVEQTPFVRQELYINESEQRLDSDISPQHQQANVAFKTRETILVTEPTIEESEHHLDVGRLPSTVQATDELTTLQGVSENVVHAQSPTEIMDTPLFKLAKAKILINEHQSVILNEPQVGEFETPLIDSLVAQKNQASYNLSLLESSKTSQMFIIEQDTKLDEFKTPQSSQAEQHFESHDAVMVENLFTCDSSVPLDQIQLDRSAAALPVFELQESKQVTSITTIDKEGEFRPKPLASKLSASVKFKEQQSIQVTTLEAVDHENKLFESSAVDTQHAKNVIGPLLALPQIEEVHSSTISTDIEISSKTHQFSRVHQDTHETVSVSEQITCEVVDDFIVQTKPDQQIASQGFDERKSIQVTDFQPTENDENLILPPTALPKSIVIAQVEPTRSLIVHEVRPISSTNDVSDFDLPLTKASVINTINEETVVSEMTAFEDVGNMRSPKQQKKYHAVAGLDIFSSIQISEADTSEKEGLFTNVKSLEFNIHPTIPTELRKSIINETTQTSQEPTTLSLVPTTLSKAHIVSHLHEQSLIFENVLLESTKATLTSDIRPQEGQATPVQDIQKSIQVSIPGSVEHEDLLLISEQNTVKASSSVLDSNLKSILIEEIHLSQCTVDVPDRIQSMSSATATSSHLEASAVTEITSYETTKPILLHTSNVPQTTIPKFEELFCTEVTEQSPGEREQLRTSNKTIEKCNALTRPTHALKSVVVEEVETSLTTGSILCQETIENKATIGSTERQLPSTTEVIALEQLNRLKEINKPQQVLATTTQDAYQSIQVQQSEFVENEEMFKPIEPTLSYGSNVPSSSFKSITIEEVHLSMVPEDFQIGPLGSKVQRAHPIIDEQESKILSEVYICDDIKQLPDFEKPQDFTATKLIDTLKSVHVSNQQISEKEQILNDALAADHRNATSTVSVDLKSAVIEEVRLYGTTHDDVLMEKTELKATITSKEFNETKISETVPLENVDTMQPLPRTQTHQATTTTESHQYVSVLNSDVSENISALQTRSAEFETAKESAPDVYHSINVDESILAVTTGKLELEKSPCDKANVGSSLSNETNVIEVVAFEDIGNEFAFKTPESKLGQSIIETHNAVIIESHLLPDVNVDNLSIQQTPTTTAGVLVGHSLVSAVVEEIQEQGSTNDVLVSSISTQVTVKQTEKDALITSETMSIEQAQMLPSSKNPVSQVASSVMDETSSVIVAETETMVSAETFDISKTQPSHHVTPTNVHSLKVVSVGESHVYGTVGALIVAENQEQATIRQEHLEATKSTLPTVYESAELYEQPVSKEAQYADTDLNLQTEVIINTVDSMCTEQPLEIDSTNRESVKPGIALTDLKSSVIEEVISNDTPLDFYLQPHETVSSKNVQTLQQQTTATTITGFEQTVCITPTNEQPAVATPTISPYQGIEHNVVTFIDTISDLQLDSPNQKLATSNFDSLGISVQNITEVEESVIDLSQIQSERNVALVQHTTAEALLIKKVRSELKELDLEIPHIKEKQAHSTFTVLNVAQKTKVETIDTAITLEADTVTPKQAIRSVASGLIVTVHEKTQCNEKVVDLKESAKPNISQAQHTVTELIAPVKILVRSEDSVTPLKTTVQTKEQFTETTYTTSNIIAETFETTPNETAKTIPNHDMEDSMQRATLVIDSNKSSIVEEVTSTESATALETIRPSLQAVPDVKQPEEFKPLEVTEVQTTETSEDLEEAFAKQLDKAKLIESERFAYEIMEKQSLLKGRYYHDALG